MCEVRIERDEKMRPGQASWFELPDELLFVLAADGVTEEGAECLQEGWRHFIRKGVWRWRQPGGRRIDCVYARVALPEGIAVRVTSAPGLVGCHLSLEHFHAETAIGLQRIARECIRAGWAYHEPFPQPLAPLLGREVA